MIGQQLLSLMYGDPADQISRTLNPGGPNPSPNPNPGAPPPPSGAPGAAPGPPGAGGGPSGAPSKSPPQPQPPMAPANATQSPPDLAALYLQLHDRDQAAAQIDRGTALMASAFGTAQQQHDMMDYAKSTPVDDRTAALSKGILAQGEVTKQQDAARFKAGAAGMSQLLGVTPEQAAWLGNDPDTMKEVLKTHFDAMSPTDQMKNVDAAVAAQTAANPGMTPQDIAAYKSKLLTGIMPGPLGEAQKVQAKDAQEFKDNALQDYTSVTNKLSTSENNVKQLLDNMPATMAAIRDPSALTTGPLAAWLPSGIGPTQSTKNAAALIDQLKAGLTGQSLQDVKNVRNQREFDTLGRALTGALTPGNSQEQVQKALEDIQKKFLDAHATAEAAVGHKLTGDLAGRANVRDLLDPKNPYYNGATEEEKPATPIDKGSGKVYTYNPKTGQLE